jgi:glycosyltransferase involved in cell wall biosynthesis
LLVNGLAELGWQQKLVARRGEELAQRCKGIEGLELIEVAGNMLSAARALGGASIVNVHEGRSIQAAALNRFWRNIPFVVTRRIQAGPRHDIATRRMYRAAARIIVLSDAIHRSVIALDPKLECWIIPDASGRLVADADNVSQLRSELPGSFVVGNVGALDDSHKGQFQIVEIARNLQDVLPEIIFVLVGSGRDESELKKRSADLSNIIFTGQVDNVGDYLAAFDVLLYPSRHEGLGSTLLDGLEFGLPVVATAVGGIPEIIDDGGNGYLLAVDDIDGMAGAIRELYSNADLRSRIGAANQKKAERFSPERMTQRYAEVYKQVIEAHHQVKLASI